MFHKLLFILTILFGVIAAEPLRPKRFTLSSDDGGIELMPQLDLSPLTNAINKLFGYKFSALSLAVSCIEWLVSNFGIVFIGAIGALGFCKLTGKCGISYVQYIPVTELQTLATPENLDMAEKFLLTAVEKYAEKKKKRSL